MSLLHTTRCSSIAVGLSANTFSIFFFRSVFLAVLPWVESRGNVTANVAFLQGADRVPPVPVHDHFTYRGTQTLNEIAADIESRGCNPVQLESMLLFTRVPAADDAESGDQPAVAAEDSPMTEEPLSDASDLSRANLHVNKVFFHTNNSTCGTFIPQIFTSRSGSLMGKC